MKNSISPVKKKTSSMQNSIFFGMIKLDKFHNLFTAILILICISSCLPEEKEYRYDRNDQSSIFPDYRDVTIPPNIAPLNFSVSAGRKAYVKLFCDQYYIEIYSDKKGNFIIPPKKWQELLNVAKGQSFKVIIFVERQQEINDFFLRNKIKPADNGLKPSFDSYMSFDIHVSPDEIDPYIAYRLIEPGYALWNKMGIYQRNLGTYQQTAVFENKLTDNNCVNCHSFADRSPDKMMLHLRAKNSGTVFINGSDIELLDTKNEHTISPLVYPSWHPSGHYVACSVNTTTQTFHPTQRVEVYDAASDVVVYDLKDHRILTTPPLFSENHLETFPTFSPDGQTLYYCTAVARPVPDSIGSLKYSLCSIGFDAATGSFARTVDTIFNAAIEDLSISFPRVSPDGRYLLCTVSSYATFPIWHADADLYILDLTTHSGRLLTEANSPQSDSYHSWSGNSRWIVYSSRRLDGLYTRPYIIHIDSLGNAARPFLLPQKHPLTYYANLMKSYNIPEFVSGRIPNREHAISQLARRKRPYQKIEFRLD